MSTLRANTLLTLSGNPKDINSLVDGETLVDRINFESDAAFNAAKVGKLSVDSTKRLRTKLLAVGDVELSGSTLRDAVVVARTVVGPTDCHAFADRTVMEDVTDYGGYGTFDATTRIRGSHVHNHLFSFQHRGSYEGSGTLQNLAGLLTRPVHAGTGTIEASFGADIGSMNITAGGAVTEQTGIRIRNQVGAAVNVALAIDQVLGWTFYATGGAPSYLKGRLGVGIAPSANYSLQVAGVAVGAKRGFIETTAAALQIGAEGDATTQFISNAAVKLQIKNAAGLYSIAPGTDNAQPLGDVTSRYTAVFAASGTITTSDAREKTAVRGLTPSELAAATALAREIGAFKFLSSIALSGDKARDHIGMTVQRAIAIMEENGLDPFGYSFICYDKWDKQTIEHGAHPEIETDAWVEVVCEAGDRFSFRMDGLLAFIAAGFEARLSALELK